MGAEDACFNALVGEASDDPTLKNLQCIEDMKRKVEEHQRKQEQVKLEKEKKNYEANKQFFIATTAVMFIVKKIKIWHYSYYYY